MKEMEKNAEFILKLKKVNLDNSVEFKVISLTRTNKNSLLA